MTTAARPTWAPAKGGEEQGGARMFGPSKKFSSRDMASHTLLKTRQPGQDSSAEVKARDLKEELLERERKHFSVKDKEKRYSDADDRRKDVRLLEGPPAKGDVESKLVPRAIDADDTDEEDKSEDEESEDEDEDDTAELLAELNRIKRERAEEQARKAAEEEEVARSAKERDIVKGNPLMNKQQQQAVGFDVKRRWDDDVVFRNQTRGEPKQQKRFINDTIRSDFHRKFLGKYVK
eukprot:jgi/Chlat1/1651/Chrsp127S01896